MKTCKIIVSVNQIVKEDCTRLTSEECVTLTLEFLPESYKFINKIIQFYTGYQIKLYLRLHRYVGVA
jgi:hypothetical protein